jgi:nucleoside-diphosphate-sugar epimerase
MKFSSVVKDDIDSILSKMDNGVYFLDKTILISGAAGFLPAYLVETFLCANSSDKIKVIALVRNISKAQIRFKHWLHDNRLEIIQHDVSIPFETHQKIDLIIHAASQASPKYFGVDPVGTLNANVLGTLNLINLAKEHNVESFLYFSSGEVYGEVEDALVPIKEDTFGYLNPATVRACYAESKRMGENICVSYFAQYGVKAKIVRPFHTYGPGMALDDGRVFADFVSNAVKNEDIVLNSDGSAKRAFCYLKDATIGFLTVLLKGENGQAYNIGNPNEEYSISELADIIARLYPESNMRVVKKVIDKTDLSYIQSPVRRNSPNIDKAMSLGWSPVVAIEEGFKRTVDSYINNKS